jgi:hypothetical protein
LGEGPSALWRCAPLTIASAITFSGVAVAGQTLETEVATEVFLMCGSSDVQVSVGGNLDEVGDAKVVQLERRQQENASDCHGQQYESFASEVF